MIRNLMLVGGPGHDFDSLGLAVSDVLSEALVETTITSDIESFFEQLRLGSNVTGETDAGHQVWDLVTVDALRWRMGAERFAGQREEWAYDIFGGRDREKAIR